ncbi:MAG: ribosome biogenesis GTPase Der [Clostridiaceae bacterium]|jgi:GTP-binding protein|nr:ribosome biogenesis GTPase Der [Clostridiaceae bacterium]
MGKPVIAIVGRPNVGKSMLFNRLIGRKQSIVEDTPGVTRDRIYAEGEWRGRVFQLIDTGGIEPKTDDQILKFMRAQAMIAIDAADVIIFIVDVRTGVTAADQDVAALLKRSKKPVVLCVNKLDAPGEPPAEFYEFYNLGMGDPVGVSAIHGNNTGDLLDACYAHFPPEDQGEEEEEGLIRVALIGKPNAGKSSLLNRIAGEERVIVSDVPGTTRDSIDQRVENQHGKYVLVDTAGIRKKARVDEDLEKISALRSIMAIERADVCLILIDATQGVTEQDTKIAGYAHENGKAAVIVVNKWDLIEKETNTQKEFELKIREGLAYMQYAPVVFLSALTGQRVDQLFPIINTVAQNNAMRITTGTLNTILAEATLRVQPPTDKGRRLKIYYMTQVGIKPPTFVCFCNDARLFHFSYLRYLENRIREVFALQGTPIKMIIRQKGED